MDSQDGTPSPPPFPPSKESPMDRRFGSRAVAIVLVLGCAPGADNSSVQTGSPLDGTRGPESRYLDAHGLRLHYVEWGNPEGRPLLLLHHVNSHARTWDHFARRMSRDYRVIALDMRGHGDSDWAEAGRYSTEDYASDVTALAEALQLEGIVALGGSTGGRVALAFAALNPHRTAALIMEDVGAVRPASIAGNFSARLARGDPAFDTVEEWADQLRGNNTRTPRDIFHHLAVHGTRPGPDGQLVLKRDPAILADLRPLELWHYVEAIDVPLLLVLGSESSIVGEDQQGRFREIRPDVEIVTVQDAGHIVVHDRVEAFEEVVRTFLRRNDL